MSLPEDPIMLLSYVNMKLRDSYDSLQEFCSAYDVEPEMITDKLAAAGFEYNEDVNQFR